MLPRARRQPHIRAAEITPAFGGIVSELPTNHPLTLSLNERKDLFSPMETQFRIQNKDANEPRDKVCLLSR